MCTCQANSTLDCSEEVIRNLTSQCLENDSSIPMERRRLEEVFWQVECKSCRCTGNTLFACSKTLHYWKWKLFLHLVTLVLRCQPVQDLSSAGTKRGRRGRLERSGRRIATLAGVSRMELEAAPTNVAQCNCPVMDCIVVKILFSTSKGPDQTQRQKNQGSKVVMLPGSFCQIVLFSELNC